MPVTLSPREADHLRFITHQLDGQVVASTDGAALIPDGSRHILQKLVAKKCLDYIARRSLTVKITDTGRKALDQHDLTHRALVIPTKGTPA